MSSDRWSPHDAEWRDPRQVVALWAGGERPSLRTRVRGRFWEALEGVCLLVTREYEHLVVALAGGEPDAHGASAPVRARRLGRARDGREHAQPQPAGRAAAGRRRGAAAGPGSDRVPSRARSTCTSSRTSAASCTGTPSARTRSSGSTASAPSASGGRRRSRRTRARLLAQLPAAQLDRGRVRASRRRSSPRPPSGCRHAGRVTATSRSTAAA